MTTRVNATHRRQAGTLPRKVLALGQRRADREELLTEKS